MGEVCDYDLFEVALMMVSTIHINSKLLEEIPRYYGKAKYNCQQYIYINFCKRCISDWNE